MRYRINHNGDRIVDASPEETHVLRPALRACFRRWRALDADIEDFCQHVELVTWQAIVDGRIRGDRFARPVDALLDFMFAVAWNQWRNHSRKRSIRCEVLHDELPDMAGPSPEGRFAARETLLRLTTREDIARILLTVLDGPSPARREGMAHSTFWARHKQATNAAIRQLALISDSAIASAVAGCADDWGVSDEDRLGRAEYLASRRDILCQQLAD